MRTSILETGARARRKLAAMGVLGLAITGVASVVLGTSSAATTLVVDDDNVECPAATFTTIQSAVNAASSGDTVQVCAGTYTNVTLNKSLALNGAQAGVDARGRAAPESTITAAGGILLELQAGSAGSRVDGFLFRGGVRGIESTGGPIDGLSLVNNTIRDFTNAGIFLNDNGLNVTIDRSVVDGSLKTGGGGLVHLDQDGFDGFQMTDTNIVNGATGTGLFSDGNRNVGMNGPRSPLLEGNRIADNNTGANLGSRSFEFASITDNTFHSNNFDGLQGGPADSTIDENTFSDNGRSGLALTSFGNLTVGRGALRNVIENNEFTGNVAEGILFSATQSAGSISTNVAHLNNIVGNTIGARYAGTETINVECNWWGSNTGPTHINNPGGTGDSVVDDGDGLDYKPFLIAAAPGGACLGPLPLPQSADDCKKGGWQTLTDDQGRPFKNQGDCVSYVATNGRNKAAG